MKNDEELEMLLGEIPHATSFNQNHLFQQQHNIHHQHHGGHGPVHVHGDYGHDSSPTQTIHNVYGMYDDDPLYRRKYMNVSPVSGVSLHSEGSSSSLLSGGFSSSDDGSPTASPLEDIKSQTPPRNTHYSNGLCLESKLPDSLMEKNTIENLTDELALLGNLRGMRIRDEQDDSQVIGRFPIGSYGFQFSDPSSIRTNHGNVEKNGPIEDYRKNIYDYGGLQCSLPVDAVSVDEQRRSALLGLQQKRQMGNLLGSCISPERYGSLFSRPGHCSDPMNSPWQQAMEHASNGILSNSQLQTDAACGRNCYHRGIWVPNAVPSITRPSISDAFLYLQRNGMDSSGDRGVLNSLGSPHLTQPKQPLGVQNLLHYNLPVFKDRTGATTNSWIPQTLPPMRGAQPLEAFSCEDSLIIQGKGMNYLINKNRDHSNEHKKCSCDETVTSHLNEKTSELDGRSHSREIPAVNSENGSDLRMHCPLLLPQSYESLLEVQGYIYLVAKDQHGCRFLQRKFDEGTSQDVQMIFNEIIDHVVELMMNPFGNYLMQKLLDVCNEEQRMHILLMIMNEPGELLKISLNTHGTRAVQKLIETLKTRQQISLVISALEPGFLDLIKDLNGNHVVQRCLQCLSTEDNKFIFDAAAKFCVDIATHRHGCCVLQRCIAHSTGEHRKNLVAEISANGLLLAQDAYGNYVVQYILDLKIPSATANLISQFEGNYVHLSTQKFSSNVVEKCLKAFGEENRSRIIHELLSASHFEQLLQDPFANYVIQCALTVSKGPIHASLVEAIRHHAADLRTSPYCKRIFSRTVSK